MYIYEISTQQYHKNKKKFPINWRRNNSPNYQLFLLERKQKFVIFRTKLNLENLTKINQVSSYKGQRFQFKTPWNLNMPTFQSFTSYEHEGYNNREHTFDIAENGASKGSSNKMCYFKLHTNLIDATLQVIIFYIYK